MSVLWQQQTHGVPKRQEQRDRALALLFFSVVVVVALLIAGYLSLLASNVHLANQVWTLKEEILQEERQNELLRVEIGQAGSIGVLQQRSIEMGYHPAEQLDFLQIEGGTP